MLVKQGLRESEVIGADEMNLRVHQRQDWVARLFDREADAPDSGQAAWCAGHLRDRHPTTVRGVAAHNGFSSYDQYRQCRHAQCNAHILMESNYVIEKGDVAKR